MAGPKRVLIVDDEPDILDAVAATIESRLENVETRIVEHPEKALEILAEGGIDLVVTDFRMPDMNGVQMLEKAREAGIDVPSILITAYSEREIAVDAARRGVIRRFYQKPLSADVLVEGVREILDPASAIGPDT